MKTKKKNKFLTFCFSLLPGAGEMYMGFMRTGVSLMLLFFLSLFIPVTLRLDVLSAVGLIVWFYGFFHANHLAGLSDTEFEQVKDEYLFGLDAIAGGRDFVTKYQKWVAAALIFSGILLLWNTLTDIAYGIFPRFVYEAMRVVGDYAPRIVIAIAIIFIGIKMIQGRKQQLAELLQNMENESAEHSMQQTEKAKDGEA